MVYLGCSANNSRASSKTICLDEVPYERGFAHEGFHLVGIKLDLVLFNSLEYCNELSVVDDSCACVDSVAARDYDVVSNIDDVRAFEDYVYPVLPLLLSR